MGSSADYDIWQLHAVKRTECSSEAILDAVRMGLQHVGYVNSGHNQRILPLSVHRIDLRGEHDSVQRVP